MKNVLIALAITGFAYGSADAQTTKTCGSDKGKVCKMAPNRKSASCYKTQYAQNFKVCKGGYGYFICCEKPTYANSTHPQINVIEQRQYTDQSENVTTANDYVVEQRDMTPQSQSYPSYAVVTANSYEGYYANNKKFIKVCYIGDNVAMENQNPYKGCPSSQFDGPDANRQRNINVSNPISLPPLAGRSHE